MNTLGRFFHWPLPRDVRERRGALAPLLEALATEVGSLEIDLPMEPAASAAAPHFEAAVGLYALAREGLGNAEDHLGLVIVRGQIVHGLQQVQAARAALEGRPPPGRSTAVLEGFCAFDPGHGRAVGCAEAFTRVGGALPVPVCSACENGISAGRWPQPRQVVLFDCMVPYWRGRGFEDTIGPLVLPPLGDHPGAMEIYDLLSPDRFHPSSQREGAG